MVGKVTIEGPKKGRESYQRGTQKNRIALTDDAEHNH